MNVEFINAINKISDAKDCPFTILDVRTDQEIKYADIPQPNQNGVYIDKINIPLDQVLKDESVLQKISKDKYIICICKVGVRSSYAAFHLKNRGYSVLNLFGGINMVSDIWRDIPKY